MKINLKKKKKKKKLKIDQDDSKDRNKVQFSEKKLRLNVYSSARLDDDRNRSNTLPVGSPPLDLVNKRIKKNKKVKSIVFWEKDSIITIRKPTFINDTTSNDNYKEKLDKNKEDSSKEETFEYITSDSDSVDLLHSVSEEKQKNENKLKKSDSNDSNNEE